MKLVAKIGGSVSIGEHGPGYEYLSGVLPVLKDIDDEHELSVGIGGGKLVRKYGEAISKFDLEDYEKEECFIEIIKANVRLLSYLLDKPPLFSFDGYEGGEVVVGGIEPGRSTDSNAAEVASRMGADLFVVLTDVNGVYDRDPDEHTDARKIDVIKFDELEDYKAESGPLDYGVLDPAAMRIIQENRIETRVIDGREPENLRKVLEGESLGTLITG